MLCALGHGFKQQRAQRLCKRAAITSQSDIHVGKVVLQGSSAFFQEAHRITFLLLYVQTRDRLDTLCLHNAFLPETSKTPLERISEEKWEENQSLIITDSL